MGAAGGAAIDAGDGGVETRDDDVAARIVVDARVREMTIDVERPAGISTVERYRNVIRIDVTESGLEVSVVAVIGQRNSPGKAGVETVIHAAGDTPTVEVEAELPLGRRPVAGIVVDIDKAAPA